MELDFHLHLNLSKEDLVSVEALRRLADLDNIYAMLHGETRASGGNYNMQELEEMLLQQEKLPAYILDFFATYSSRQEQIKNFHELYHRYFSIETGRHNGFVHKYLVFERQVKLVFTALRALHLGRDLKKEFSDEDPEDPFIQQLMEQKASSETPEGFEEVKTMFEQYKEKPFDLYQALAEWRFRKVEEIAGRHTFYIDRILAFIVQLEICEKWLELDKAKGLQIIETTVKEVA